MDFLERHWLKLIAIIGIVGLIVGALINNERAMYICGGIAAVAIYAEVLLN